MLVFIAICLNSIAQKVATVSVTSKTNLSDAFYKCKEAGKKAGYGSRNIEEKNENGKLTLWQGSGTFIKTEMVIEITAVYKDGITTLLFKMPHNPKIVANYPREIKKVVSKLKLPEMMIGEYFDGIE